VEGENYLGIYLSKADAAMVCVDSKGTDQKVLGCFSVSAASQDADESGHMPELARLIAEGCAQRQLSFSEAYVALDCAMFMQHNVHSDFKSPKQIGQTVRFDAEEALSSDISKVALAYKILSTDDRGSNLTVFTVEHEVLSEVLLGLQGAGIDPITVEPDVNCISRFIEQNLNPSRDLNTLFALLSQRSGYFIQFAKSQETPTTRTFLVGPNQDRNAVLARQTLLTSASFDKGRHFDKLEVLDSAGIVDPRQLQQELGVPAGQLELTGAFGDDSEIRGQCPDPVHFAIAYGAALAHSQKPQSVNFRNDYMPYQGKKLRLQKTIKFLSLSVAVLMIALGVYVTARLIQVNSTRRQLYKNLASQYEAVALGQKMPKKINDALRKLGSISRGIERSVKPGQDDDTVAARLTLLLQAFNECAKSTNLNIEKITVTDKTISVTGDTSNLRNTNKFLDTLKKRMEIPKVTFAQKGPRHSFSITVVPKIGAGARAAKRIRRDRNR